MSGRSCCIQGYLPMTCPKCMCGQKAVHKCKNCGGTGSVFMRCPTCNPGSSSSGGGRRRVKNITFRNRGEEDEMGDEMGMNTTLMEGGDGFGKVARRYGNGEGGEYGHGGVRVSRGREMSRRT